MFLDIFLFLLPTSVHFIPLGAVKPHPPKSHSLPYYLLIIIKKEPATRFRKNNSKDYWKK